MKYHHITLGAWLLCAACAPRADEYVIRGEVPGLQDGMTVVLRSIEQESSDTLAVDTVRNDRFELRGSVAAPTFCDLAISNRPIVAERRDAKTRKAWVFLDNSRLTLRAPHFDSIGYVSTIVCFENERVGCVAGSPLQEEFNAYRRALKPVELEAWQPNDSLSRMRFEKYRYDPDEYARLYAELWPQLLNGQAAVKAARMDFIRNHPQSPVSLFAAEKILEDAGNFALTRDELEELAASAQGATDTLRLARLAKRIERAKDLAHYAHFADLALKDLDGREVSLSGFVPAGRYTLVDFWASWCGPCRAALPKVKAMIRRYEGRLGAVSVSCDEKEEDWKKAVRKEALTEWPQLRVDSKEAKMAMRKHYNVSSIPNLVLIDPQGQIVFSTYDADGLNLVIKEQLNR